MSQIPAFPHGRTDRERRGSSPLSRRQLLLRGAAGLTAAAAPGLVRDAAGGQMGPRTGAGGHFGLRTGAGGQTGPRAEVRLDRVADRMEQLSRIGAGPDGGISRTAGSDADLAARELYAGWLREAGCEVRTDLAGNQIGRLEGSEPSLAPLATGSHLDSVPSGGNFDGAAGCVASLEAVAALGEAGIRLRHPVEILNFFNEENGKTGSRVLAGEVAPEEMDLPAYGGMTLGEAMERVGGSPERIAEAALAPGAFESFLELHIEQGPTLDSEGLDIGVVEGIVGIRRFRVTVTGVANHAGTTAMAIRRDPMVTAARIVAAVHDETLERPGRQVATVGYLEARPGAANVIPGEVEFTLEVRDLSMEVIASHYERLRAVAQEIAARNGTEVHFEPYYLSRAAPCDPALVDLVFDVAGDLGFRRVRMPSGAGHDAQSIAVFAPIGMVFVPSRDGISHSPREWTSIEEITNGAAVIAEALRRRDEAPA